MCRGSGHLASHCPGGSLSSWRHTCYLSVVLDISWLAFRGSVPFFRPHEPEGLTRDAPPVIRLASTFGCFEMDVAVIEIKSRGLFPFGEPRHGGDDEGPSNIQVLLSLVGVALTLVGGYFLVMKLINMSRLEGCLLAGNKNCIPIELPRKTE
jgi:hypothetical protein